MDKDIKPSYYSILPASIRYNKNLKFGEKIQNLDFIAIAPYIFDAHSPKERCSISSLKRIYNYIIIILQNL